MTTESKRWVASNQSEDTVWHKAKLYEIRGPITGKVLHSGYKPACGSKLRSAYGHTVTLEEPKPFIGVSLCKRCFPEASK